VRLLERDCLRRLEGCLHPVHIVDIRRHGDGAAAIGWQVVDDVRRKVLEEPGALGLVRGPRLTSDTAWVKTTLGIS
jgi:hypothetical protein